MSSADNASTSLPVGVWRLQAGVEDAGQRLDQYLAAQLPQLSRGQWRRVIDLGGVHCNGRRMRRCSTEMAAGDRVEAYLDGRPLEPFRFGDELVIYRDPYLLALNKPVGVETQPTHARFVGSLYEALLSWLRDQSKNPRHSPELGMVQRLDRDTSGLMVFSTHVRAHAALTRSFAGRDVRKTYLALVGGAPPLEGEFRSLLARSRKANLVKSVPAGGKEAITRFRRLACGDGFALVEVEPLTGRSHQIRVHFAEAGFPLLGDRRYGGIESVMGTALRRHQLHAWKLDLAHPVEPRRLALSAPLAEDMHDLLLGCGWNAETLSARFGAAEALTD